MIAALLWFGAVQDDAELRAALVRLESEYLSDRLEGLRVLEAAGARAEALLIEALGSEETRVRLHAVRLLTKLASKTPVHQIGAMAQEGGSLELERAAFDYLRAVPELAEDYLIPALSHPQAGIRSGALEALGRAKSARAVPAAARLFETDPDEKLREAAFKFLESIGAPAEGELVRLLGSKKSEVRQKVLSGALKNSRSEAVLRAVGSLFLVEPDEKVLGLAHGMLTARYPDSGGLSETFMIRALRDGTPAARRLAVKLLRERGSTDGVEPAGELLVANRDGPLRDLLVMYLKPHASARPFFERAVREGAPETATAALGVLAELKDFRAVEAAAELYRASAPEAVRLAAVGYLRGSADPRAEPVLIRALKDEKEPVRLSAIEGLGALRTPAAVAALARQISAGDEREQGRIRAVLARFKAEALWAILTSDAAAELSEETRGAIRDLHVRVAVEEFLDTSVARGQGIGTYPGQFDGLRREPLEAERVDRVLREMIGSGALWLSEPAGDATTDRRRELAALALADLAGEGAADALEHVWKEDLSRGDGINQLDVRVSVAVALHRAGRPQARDELVAWLERQAAQQAEGGARPNAVLALDLGFRRALVLARTGAAAAALKAYEELAAKASALKAPYPSAAALHYNLACLQARLGRGADAVASLGKAVAAGFADRAWIERDRDLDSLRESPAFKELIEKLPKPGP
jgi:HEAT repeat protein